MLAAFVIALLTQAPDPAYLKGPIYSSAARSSKPFKLKKSWRWPHTVSGSQLATTATPNIFRHCALNVAGAGAAVWKCVAPDGSTPGSWTSNTGLETAPTFIEGTNAFYSDVTGGPQLSGDAALDSALNGAYTITALVYTKTPASGSGWVFQTLGTGAIALLYTGGVSEMNDGAASSDNSKSCVGKWCLMMFCSDGAGHVTNRVDATQVTASGAHTSIATGFHTFGNRKAQDQGYEGWLAFVDVYNANLCGTSQQDSTRQEVYGVGNSAGLTGGSAGGGIYNPTLNTVEFFNQGFAASPHHIHGTSGMLCSKGHVNFASTDARDVSKMVDYKGTPTLSLNVSRGPTANYKHGGAECDVISCATGGCGKEGATSDAGAGYYTNAALAKAGLDGGASVTLGFDSDGVIATPSCTFNGLTPDAGLVDCTSRIDLPADGGTAVTFVKPTFATPDGGSFQLCWYGLNYGANVETLQLDNTPVGASNFSLTSSDIPDVTKGGKVIWWHTPLYDPSSQWFVNQGDYYMFDATTSGGHSITEIFGYTVAGRLYAQASADTSFFIDGIGMTPNTVYGTSVEWRPTTGGQCRITVKQAAVAVGSLPGTVVKVGSGACPTQPDSVILCDRFDHSVPSSFIFNGIDWSAL